MSTERPNRPQDEQTMLIFVGIAFVVVFGGGVFAAQQWSARQTTGQWAPEGPADLILGTAKGDIPWTGHSTTAASVIGVVVAVLITAVGILVMRRRNGRQQIDKAAADMSRGRELHREVAVKRAAQGNLAPDHLPPGMELARPVGGKAGTEVWSNWRDTVVVIMGPGGGKTTSVAIPQGIAAPGVLWATSNKRDIADALLDPRGEVGRVWVFDPQDIAHYDAEPSWWWDPISYVTSAVRSVALAKLFADADEGGGSAAEQAKRDYFEDAGRTLIGFMLLACSVAKRPITQVYYWLSDPQDADPARILRDRYPLQSAGLTAYSKHPEEQRGGEYSTAIAFMAFLANDNAVRWITPTGPDDKRPQFSPDEFVRSGHDTGISLSKEGTGSCGPLVAALTVAVTEAAERYAEQSGGRLPVPLIALLDEVANVCRWKDLPNQFSHYGSRGITLIAILQNRAQGVRVWGKDGMQQMYDAATVRIIGSGLEETAFLEEVSKRVGEHYVQQFSSGTSRGHKGGSRSVNVSTAKERILDVAALASMPGDRCLIIPAGARPVLCQTMPWWTRDPDRAAKIGASIAAHQPANQTPREVVTT